MSLPCQDCASLNRTMRAKKLVKLKMTFARQSEGNFFNEVNFIFEQTIVCYVTI